MDQPEILGESAARFPLSSRQRDPDGMLRLPGFVASLALRVKGELQVDSLRDAVGDVVERHESLRTRIHYSETDGNVGFQEVLPSPPVPFTVRDITVAPGQSREEVAVGLLTELNDEQLPFSVTPSLRAALHRFDDHDAVLTVLINHLFGDGWSTDILRRDIAACYKARVTGVPHALPVPVPYREFVSWEQEFLHGERAAAARRFWQGKLAGAELFTMPADRLHSPDTLMPESAIGNFSIDPGRFAKVTASAAQSRCSIWNLLLAAFMVLAEKVTGRSDITLITPTNGRPAREFYETIGFFVNPLPVRLEFGNCASFRDLMLLARKASADAWQHQLSFPMILEVASDLAETVDPQALLPTFNYQNYSPLAQDDAGFATSVEPVVMPEELPTNFVRGFLWTFLVVSPGEFRCCIEYEPDAVEPSTIERWGSEFIDLILAIADEPDQAWKKL